METADKRLATDLFMALLSDLSAVMGSKDGMDCGVKDVEEVPLLAPQGSEDAQRMERKLLAFEKELDATMAKLRMNLMIIRLLGKLFTFFLIP